MQISYRRLIRFNALITIEAQEDKVIETHHNIFEHIVYEHYYKDLNKNIVRGRLGESGWSSIGWSLVVAPFFLYIFIFTIFLPDLRRIPIAMAIYTFFLVFGILAFLMRFVKDDWVWFYDNKNEVSFVIKIKPDEKSEAENLIQFIQEKIRSKNGN